MRPCLLRSTALLAFCAISQAQTVNSPQVDPELLRHYQALVRIDTAKDPARANLIARLKGNGSKRPILLMGHTDTVKVDPSKWSFPPFSATRDGGYVYGRGSLDNKWQR